MSKRSNFDELKAILEKAKSTNFAELDKAAHDVIHFFVQIQDRLNSEDDKERAGALKDLETLQEELNAYAKEASEKSNMSPHELHVYMQQKENFSEEEWSSLQRAEKELKDYEHALIRATKGKKPHQVTSQKGVPGKKRPPRSDWLSS